MFLGLWCKSSMASSNLAGPGANPGGPALVAGRSGSVISLAERPQGSLRFETAIRPRPTTATTSFAAGRSGAVIG
jgi:hypothetical protein